MYFCCKGIINVNFSLQVAINLDIIIMYLVWWEKYVIMDSYTKYNVYMDSKQRFNETSLPDKK